MPIFVNVLVLLIQHAVLVMSLYLGCKTAMLCFFVFYIYTSLVILQFLLLVLLRCAARLEGLVLTVSHVADRAFLIGKKRRGGAGEGGKFNM